MLAGVVVLLGIVLLALPPRTQAAVRGVLRSSLLAPFIQAQVTLVKRGARSGDTEALRSQRDSLLMVLAASRPLAEENRRLRALLGLYEQGGERFVPADVIRPGLASAAGTFMLDVGRDHGIRVGSPVITAEGLLGVVEVVDARTAQAIDWTQPEFRASAMSSDGGVYGLVQPRPGRIREEDALTLTGAPFHSDLKPGTRIVTSGRGELLPRGIPLGTVVGIEDADTGWRKSYILRPAVRPEAVRHVLVGTPADSAGRGVDYSHLWYEARTMDGGRGGGR